MCCFSRPVESVSSTNIFARDAGNGRQFLVYSMVYRAAEDLAMVLPLPVAPNSGEDAVRFIDLHAYADFFKDLKSGFPEPAPRNILRSKAPAAASADTLAVVQVGSFEASFVPQIKDFSRLDARFRLPDGVWNKLPAYSRFGFAVFKLRKSAESVHPMALTFPTADASKLFFPTVHIHDGQVHATAHFDHSLYCQVGSQHRRVTDWRESPQAALSFMRVKDSQGLIDGSSHCYLKQLRGNLKNQDTYV
jgi:hypothetical protein